MAEPYSYITPTIETSDPRMRKALDGWLWLYEACYVIGSEMRAPFASPAPIPSDLFDALIMTAKALNTWGGRWIVAGGLAMNYHGRDRASDNVRFYVLEKKASLTRVLDRLAKNNITPHEIDVPGLSCSNEHWWIPLQYVGANSSRAEVDLLAADNEFMEFVHESGRESQIAGTRLRIVGPEALVVMNLQTFRGQDRSDLEDLFRLKSNLDRDLLSAWVKKFKLEARLAEIERIIKENPGRRG